MERERECCEQSISKSEASAKINIYSLIRIIVQSVVWSSRIRCSF